MKEYICGTGFSDECASVPPVKHDTWRWEKSRRGTIVLEVVCANHHRHYCAAISFHRDMPQDKREELKTTIMLLAKARHSNVEQA